MNMIKKQNGTQLEIALEGRLDTKTAPALEAELNRSLESIDSLVMDFSKLEYISSAGLRALLIAYKALNGKGGLKVLNANELVMEVLDVTGFSKSFRSREEAAMKTDVITLSNQDSSLEEALRQVDKVAAYKDLSEKNTLDLRLLAEEMMGMVRSITGEKDGVFWIEDENGVYALHLQVRTLMDEEQRRQLISASSQGKNEATRGLMGKLRAFFELAGEAPVYSGLLMPGGAPQMYGSLAWSLESYREQLRQYGKENSAEAREAWDELEKSIVAHVADDVKVSIRGRTAEMTVIKKIA